MTPAIIYQAVRDLVILIALGFVLWYVHRADTNAVQVKDFAAVTKQLSNNADQVAAWQEEQTRANAQRQSEFSMVSGAIAQQHNAVLLCNRPAGPSPVPARAAAPAAQPPGGGGPDARSRAAPEPEAIDLRPGINALELKYEAALASCRSVLNEWPSATKEKP